MQREETILFPRNSGADKFLYSIRTFGQDEEERGNANCWWGEEKEKENKAVYDLFVVQECVNHLEIAGDKCLILPGRYHEEVIINKKFATKEKPFVIEGAFDFDSRTRLDTHRCFSLSTGGS